MFGTPRRLRRQEGRHALVDGIPFAMPVTTRDSRAVMAAFPVDLERAAALLPGDELQPFRLFRHGLLFVTVIDYRVSPIGPYIEYSIALACTRGRRRPPPLMPAMLQGPYGFGQYVLDLPVSSEVSVKGGKGIWGMPKHQAPLDFIEEGRTVSCQYDLDGRMVTRLDLKRPRLRSPRLPALRGINYTSFRGMVFKSKVHFSGTSYLSLKPFGRARFTLGDHPRADVLRDLDIGPRPLFTVYQDGLTGQLDDHLEAWFITSDEPPEAAPEGLESVATLGQSQEWPAPPARGGWKSPW